MGSVLRKNRIQEKHVLTVNLVILALKYKQPQKIFAPGSCSNSGAKILRSKGNKTFKNMPI
jgi:hypothetical protein